MGNWSFLFKETTNYPFLYQIISLPKRTTCTSYFNCCIHIHYNNVPVHNTFSFLSDSSCSRTFLYFLLIRRGNNRLSCPTLPEYPTRIACGLTWRCITRLCFVIFFVEKKFRTTIQRDNLSKVIHLIIHYTTSTLQKTYSQHGPNKEIITLLTNNA